MCCFVSSTGLVPKNRESPLEKQSEEEQFVKAKGAQEGKGGM
jgi:hypothetical protein